MERKKLIVLQGFISCECWQCQLWLGSVNGIHQSFKPRKWSQMHREGSQETHTMELRTTCQNS